MWRVQLGLTWLLFLCLTPLCGSRPDPHQRDALIEEELRRQIGGGVVLNLKEKLLDEKLSQMKQQEMAAPDFPPAMHFFKAKSLIDASPVFSFLQKMPKGTIMLTLFRALKVLSRIIACFLCRILILSLCRRQ